MIKQICTFGLCFWLPLVAFFAGYFVGELMKQRSLDWCMEHIPYTIPADISEPLPYEPVQ